MSAVNDTQALLSQRWTGLAPRERLMIAAMGGALAFLLLWLVAVRPAWRTLDQAPVLRARADMEMLQMGAIANEVRQLRALPPVQPSQAEQVLKSATERLGGKAKLAIQGDHATLTLTGVSGHEMMQWLTEARGGAHARPLEASLTRAGDGYNGTLVVAIGSPQ